MKLKERIKEINSYIPALFISLKSRKTPALAKVFAALTVANALSPIDLIPDFIPVLGYLDDLVILPLLISLTVRFIPKEVFNTFLEEAKGETDPKKRWFYAIPIVLVWALVIFLIVKRIFFTSRT